jgi:hypothetical protein
VQTRGQANPAVAEDILATFANPHEPVVRQKNRLPLLSS